MTNSAGQRRPIVPEQRGGRGDVAFFAERVAAQQAVDHRLGGLEAAAIDGPHVGEGVEDVHPPLAIDLLARGTCRRGPRRASSNSACCQVVAGVLHSAWKPRASTRSHSARVKARTITGILRRDAGPDAVLGGEAGHQGGGLLRAALRVQVVVEGEVLVVGRLAQRFVAADGAVVLALRAEHLAHEEALAHLRGPVGRRGHRHLGRGVEAAGQAAKLQDLELVALGDRQQLRRLGGPGCTPRASRTDRWPGSRPARRGGSCCGRVHLEMP